MKITKYIHSCLLVESDDGRVAVIDPGSMSYDAFDFDKLETLNEILITHIHQDHMHIPFIEKLLDKFPKAKVVGPQDVVDELIKVGIEATTKVPDGVELFDAPHEEVAPLFPRPDEYGYHYLGVLSDPGDSHSFTETKEILALPITAPWGSSIKAINLAIELKPKHVIPIHDWHWSEIAQQGMYSTFEKVLKEYDIEFHSPVTGKPINIDI
jgi:L-ascorbate metabolism protein UlaG (beta-lactamase superfamily)